MNNIENVDLDRSGLLSPTPHIFWHEGKVAPETRPAGTAQRTATLWLTGLSGSGKSTLACELEQMLVDAGRPAYVLDGDNLRHRLNRDLGFSPRDRQENIRRSAEVARLMNEAGLIVIAAFISPMRQDRDMARAIIGNDSFIEAYVSTPCRVCEERDPKGLYKKARSGEIPEFTGISAPYEVPLYPDLVLDTETLAVQQACGLLFQQLTLRLA